MINIVKETAPHIRRHSSVNKMMIDVLIALSPVVIFSIIVYGLSAVKVIGISSFTMILAEFVYVGLRNKMPNDGQKHSFKELFLFAYKDHYSHSNWIAPLVSALIFSMIMPANATWYACFIGSLAGIVLATLVFGGLGNNIFNPAAVGMLIAKICFSGQYPSAQNNWFIDVSTGPTPLTDASEGIVNALNNASITNLLIGNIGGTLGETFKVLIIIGAIYLLIKRSADYRVMLSYIGSFTLLILITGLCMKFGRGLNINYFKYVGCQLLTGGLLFGATFMLTDPVTSPITSPGRVMYGIIAGCVTVLIRFFAATPEGVVFAILISNMLAPVIDYYKWSSPKYSVKKLIVMAIIFVLTALVLILAIMFAKEGGAWYVK